VLCVVLAEENLLVLRCCLLLQLPFTVYGFPSFFVFTEIVSVTALYEYRDRDVAICIKSCNNAVSTLISLYYRYPCLFFL